MASSPHVAALQRHHTPGAASDLVPAQPQLLITVDALLSEVECTRLISNAHTLGLHPPTAADLTPRKNEAFLNRESTSFTDAAFAQLVWQRLRPFLPDVLEGGRTPVGLYADGNRQEASKFKFYRYAKGMRFDAHVDQSWKGANPGEETEYTLLIYLNDAGAPVHDCDQPLVGGDTIFMANARSELCRVRPKAGMALLHAHGRRCLMHSAEEVSRGVKYVLRADVMYRRAGAQPGREASGGGAAAGGGPSPCSKSKGKKGKR